MRKEGRFLDKSIAYLGYVSAALGVLGVFALIILIGTNVFLRFLFNKPMISVDEFSEYIFAVVVYMGLAYTTRMRGHISIDMLVRRLSKRARDRVDLINLLLALLLISIYFWFVWKLFIQSIVFHWVASTYYQTPQWVPWGILTIGLVFLIVELIALIVKKFIEIQSNSKGEKKTEPRASLQSLT